MSQYKYDFTSPGASMYRTIEDVFVRRAMDERQRLEDDFRRRQTEEQGQRANAQLQLQQQQEERIRDETRRQGARQTAADALEAEIMARERSALMNQRGVRQMIGERLTSGPLDPDTARQIEGMAYAEDVPVPAIIAQAQRSPQRTVVRTMDDRGRPIRRAVTEEELTSGVREYVEPAPVAGRNPSDYRSFLIRWAAEHGKTPDQLSVREELDARTQFSGATRDQDENDWLFGEDEGSGDLLMPSHGPSAPAPPARPRGLQPGSAYRWVPGRGLVPK